MAKTTHMHEFSNLVLMGKQENKQQTQGKRRWSTRAGSKGLKKGNRQGKSFPGYIQESNKQSSLYRSPYQWGPLRSRCRSHMTSGAYTKQAHKALGVCRQMRALDGKGDLCQATTQGSKRGLIWTLQWGQAIHHGSQGGPEGISQRKPLLAIVLNSKTIMNQTHKAPARSNPLLLGNFTQEGNRARNQN